MGDWYNKTDWQMTDCSLLVRGQCDRGSGRFFDGDFLFSLGALGVCSNTTDDRGVLHYVRDAHDTLRRGPDEKGGPVAALFRFGDTSSYRSDVAMPVISKARPALSEEMLDRVLHPLPIIWPLNTKYHYVRDLEKYHVKYKSTGNEVPWEEKLPAVIWRGKPTGTRFKQLRRWIRLDSDVVDVAFTGVHVGFERTRRKFVSNNLVRDRMSSHEMTRYKYLLSVEG